MKSAVQLKVYISDL